MKWSQIFFILILFVYQNESFSYPKITPIKSNPNYLLITDNSLPIIDLGISIDAGSTDDGKLHGLTNLTFELLSKIKYENQKIMDLFENIGAKFNYQVGKDFSTINIRFIKNDKNITHITNLINFILLNREVSDEDIEFLKEKITNGIDSQFLNPGSLVRIKANEKFFIGTEYQHPIIGYKESISLISNSDVINHLKKIFTRKSMEINLVGNITENEGAQIIYKILNNVPKGMEKMEKKTKLKFNGKMYLQKIPMASKQTHIYIIIPAVKRLDEDYYSLLVGNYIFGGSGFGSKLFNEIRQKRGLAYSVYSYLRPYKEFGVFIINMQTKNENAEEAIQILKNEIYKIKKDFFTAQDMSNAKEGMLGDFYIRYDTNRKMLRLLTHVNFLNFDLNYFERYENKIKGVTEKSIKNVIRKYIHLEKSIITTVGNF